LLGTWVGYVENHKFSSGSDALQLTIRAADTASLCGSITFGETTPALPPPNPDIGYPPGQDLTQYIPSFLPIERFAHTLQGGLVSGKRVRFQAATLEPWRTWCGMQRSYLQDSWSSTYTCIDGYWGSNWNPDGGPSDCYVQDPNTGTQKPIDCGKAYDCAYWQVCACNVTGCAADSIYPLDFDAQFEAGEARGSIVLYTQNGQQVFNIYLTKTD
jgi:hypothetical protein